MKTHNLRAALGLALAGSTLAIPAVVIEVIATSVPTVEGNAVPLKGLLLSEAQLNTHAATSDTRSHHLHACHFEDGSGQSRCVWDARTMGNGAGHSFVAFDGGTDRARYVYVSHRVARELLGGAR